MSQKKLKSKFSTILVSLSLLSFSVATQALESGIEGDVNSADFITTSAWDALATSVVTIPNTGTPWHCAVTCSAEAERTNGNTLGTFAIRRNGVAQTGSTRSFSLNVRVTEVTSTLTLFNLAAGRHTLQCAARKNSSNQKNYRINDSSISISCSDFRL